MDLKELIKKRPQLPPRILIYSIPGWGKSTLAASMPGPVFLDIEDGLSGMDVASIQIENFKKIDESIGFLINEKHEYKTVVVDTLSSLERIIFERTCEGTDKTTVEGFGYGKGYRFAMKFWERIISGMDRLRKKGIAPVLLAHSEVKTFADPMNDSYDKYIINLHKLPAAMVTQWADNIFFGTHRTIVKKEPGSGFSQKSKAIGHGDRVIYTEDRPAFTAKSRLENIPFEIDIPKVNGWSAVSKYFSKKGDEK